MRTRKFIQVDTKANQRRALRCASGGEAGGGTSFSEATDSAEAEAFEVIKATVQRAAEELTFKR